MAKIWALCQCYLPNYGRFVGKIASYESLKRAVLKNRPSNQKTLLNFVIEPKNRHFTFYACGGLSCTVRLIWPTQKTALTSGDVLSCAPDISETKRLRGQPTPLPIRNYVRRPLLLLWLLLWDALFSSYGGFVKPDAKKRAIPRLSGRECHFWRPISLKRSVGQASRYRESRKLCPKMTSFFMTFGSGTHRFWATEDLSGPTLKNGRFFGFCRTISRLTA